jgi:hypothetical protein
MRKPQDAQLLRVCTLPSAMTAVHPVRAEAWPHVVQQYAEQIPFLWQARADATRSWSATRETLAQYDQRLVGCLDGLRIAGTAADTIVEDAWVSSWPGERFARMVRALEHLDLPVVLRLASGAHDRQQQLAAVSAFGFASTSNSLAAVHYLAGVGDANARLLAARVCTITERDTISTIRSLLADDDARVAAAAWRSTRAIEFLPMPWIQMRIPADPDVAAERLRALWQHTRNEQHLLALLELTASDSAWWWRIADCVRHAPLERSSRWMAQAFTRPAHLGLALRLAAACADTRALDALIERLPLLPYPDARVALTSLALILGSERLIAALLRDDAHHGEVAESPWADSDPTLPDALAAWWSVARTEIPPDARLLNGAVITDASISQALTTAAQPIRRAAAVEWRGFHSRSESQPMPSAPFCG